MEQKVQEMAGAGATETEDRGDVYTLGLLLRFYLTEPVCPKDRRKVCGPWRRGAVSDLRCRRDAPRWVRHLLPRDIRFHVPSRALLGLGSSSG